MRVDVFSPSLSSSLDKVFSPFYPSLRALDAEMEDLEKEIERYDARVCLQFFPPSPLLLRATSFFFFLLPFPVQLRASRAKRAWRRYDTPKCGGTPPPLFFHFPFILRREFFLFPLPFLGVLVGRLISRRKSTESERYYGVNFPSPPLRPFFPPSPFFSPRRDSNPQISTIKGSRQGQARRRGQPPPLSPPLTGCTRCELDGREGMIRADGRDPDRDGPARRSTFFSPFLFPPSLFPFFSSPSYSQGSIVRRRRKG